MIEAATDFSKAVLEALSALRKAVQELRRLTEDELSSSSGGVSPQAREVMKEAVEKAEEAEEQLPRFLLLFGRSRVTHAAVRQVNALREAVSWASATSPYPLGSPDDQYDVKSEIFNRIDEADEALHDALDTFYDDALRSLQDPQRVLRRGMKDRIFWWTRD